MATVGFYEAYRCMGVDQDADHHPAMIVPRGQTRTVVLETSGMDVSVVPANRTIDVKEVDGKGDLLAIRDLRDLLDRPGVDSQFRDAMMPPTRGHWNKPRFFRVFGNLPTGFPGTLVEAVAKRGPGRRAPGVVARLRVAVVDYMIIRVAIRNVRARDQQGNMRYHAKHPCNPAEELFRMNAVWTPQTNIVFDLVSSADAVVDHDDPKTQEELKRSYGLKPESRATFHPESTVRARFALNWDVLARQKVPGAHITFFLVHQVFGGGDPVYGRGGTTLNGSMNTPSWEESRGPTYWGISLISGTHLPTTFAHEAGHFVGDMRHKGTDVRLLMRGEGAGWKIPFGLAEQFRRFKP